MIERVSRVLTTPPSTNCYHPCLRFELALTYGALQMLTNYLLTFIPLDTLHVILGMVNQESLPSVLTTKINSKKSNKLTQKPKSE